MHPGDERIAGCKHVVFTAPGERRAALAAQRHLDPSGLARPLALRHRHVGQAGRAARARRARRWATSSCNRSVIGTRFGGRIVDETEVGGLPAVVPEIKGRAWITGMGQYVLDPEDPFPAGFAL